MLFMDYDSIDGSSRVVTGGALRVSQIL